ncbi:hypothetical protein D3C84_1305970 [compost metagenome]
MTGPVGMNVVGQPRLVRKAEPARLHRVEGEAAELLPAGAEIPGQRLEIGPQVTAEISRII